MIYMSSDRFFSRVCVKVFRFYSSKRLCVCVCVCFLSICVCVFFIVLSIQAGANRHIYIVCIQTQQQQHMLSPANHTCQVQAQVYRLFMAPHISACQAFHSNLYIHRSLNSRSQAAQSSANMTKHVSSAFIWPQDLHGSHQQLPGVTLQGCCRLTRMSLCTLTWIRGWLHAGVIVTTGVRVRHDIDCAIPPSPL